MNRRSLLGKLMAMVAAFGMVFSMLQMNIAVAVADDTGTAQAGTVDISLEQTSADTQPTGSIFKYALSFSCSTVDLEVCLDNGVITIPLDEAKDYKVQIPTTLPDGVESMKVVDGEIVVTLKPIGSAADGITVEFFIWSERGVKEHSWDLIPTVTGDGLDPVEGDKVTSTVTAEKAPFNVTKTSNKRYYPGQVVNWKIGLECNGNDDGLEWPESFTIVDELPQEVEFVSAPEPWEYDADTHTVSRPVDNVEDLCSKGSKGIYEIKTTAKADLKIGDEVTNNVTATANWSDGTTTEDKADEQILIIEPEFNKGLAQKRVASALDDTLGTSRETFAGDWLPKSHGESRYNVRLTTDDQGFTMGMTDRFPCLDNQTSSGVYESLDDKSGICEKPGWHLTRVEMANDQFQGNVPPAVTVTLTDGSEQTLAVTLDNGSLVRWDIPGDIVEKVAQVNVGEFQKDGWGNVRFYGYADESLKPGDVLVNRADVHVNHETWEDDRWETWTPPKVDLIIADALQVGIEKSGEIEDFDKMKWKVEAAVTSPHEATDDVVITDLLPEDVLDAPFADGDEVEVEIRQGRGIGALPTNWETVKARVEVVDNHANTGRTLIRWILPPEVVNAEGQDATMFQFRTTFVTPAPYPGKFTNDAGVFLNDPTATDFLCVNGGQDSDPMDLDGRPGTQKHCAASADLSIPPGPGVASMRLLKEVKGDLDDDFRRNLAVSHVSEENGTAEYRLTFENRTQNALNGVVLYDTFPFIGDTGVSKKLSTVERGSAFVPKLNGKPTVPEGVTVEYSTSENPCRDEVFPNAENTDCVDDWSSTAPADLSTVRALKFVSTKTYANGEGFTVEYGMDAPPVNHGEIAWNSVATRATDATNGLALPPIEAPKVGITRPGAPDLVIDKVVDKAEAKVGDTLTYTIGVQNVGTLPAFDTVVTDQLPANVEFKSASDDGTEKDGVVTWNIDQLDAGESATFTVTVIVLEAAEDDTIVNAVGAEGVRDPEDPDAPPVPAKPTPETVCEDDPSRACAVTEVPGPEEPGPEEPGGESPGPEDPGTEEPGGEAPGPEEPGTEEPGTEEPGTEEPGGEAPVNSGNPDRLAYTGASGLALLGGAVLVLVGLGVALILLSRRQSAQRSASGH